MLRAIAAETERVREELGPGVLSDRHVTPRLSTWVLPLAVQHAHSSSEILSLLQRLDRLLANAASLQESLRDVRAAKEDLLAQDPFLREVDLDTKQSLVQPSLWQPWRRHLAAELEARELYAPTYAQTIQVLDEIHRVTREWRSPALREKER